MMAGVFTVFFVFLAFAQIVECGECPTGWTHYGTSCYVFLRDQVNWYEAKVACGTVGGHLVEIEGADDNNFVAGLLHNNHVNYAWMGLEDLLVEGSFVWATNATAPVYTNFHSHQPDDAGHNQDCVIIRSNGEWYDDECHSASHTTVCQTRSQVSDGEEVVG